MSNATDIKSYTSSVVGNNIDYDGFSTPVINSDDVSPGSLKVAYKKVAQAARIVGVATIVVMLTDVPEPPSHTNPYASVFEFDNQSAPSIIVPYGYAIVNYDEIRSYLLKFPKLKYFLETSLGKFQDYTGSSDLSLEYEGMAEEGWENLYVLIHMDEYDDDQINSIEKRMFEEWLNNVPEDVIQNITISIG